MITTIVKPRATMTCLLMSARFRSPAIPVPPLAASGPKKTGTRQAHNRKSLEVSWTMPMISISKSAMRSPSTSPLTSVKSLAVPSWSNVW